MKIETNRDYKTRSGLSVKIFWTEANGFYPILGAVEQTDGVWLPVSWTETGKFRKDQLCDDLDLVEVSPYAGFKVDDKVLVWDKGDNKKLRRHFFGISETGAPLAFAYGCSSFSVESRSVGELRVLGWDFCEKYTEENEGL